DVVVHIAFETPHDGGELVVQRCGVGGSTRDDQGGAGLVDQDRVDLVDDRVVVAPLDLVLLAGGHVVAQVVEAELVVGSVGDVAAVLGPFVGGVVIAGYDQTDAEAHP